jgi:serine/threonine-protein kinase
LRRQGGVLPVSDAIRLSHLIADTLAAVHARGIIHRDLKPDNVMIVADPNVPGGERTKLLDFGIAKLTEGSGLDRTRTAALMGTPHFMSPEQCRGAGGVDDRSDVYALGVVLYLALAGRPPFDGAGLGEIMGKHMYEAPPPLASVAQVPIGLAQLVDRLLHKDPRQRPPMGQVATELLILGQSLGQMPAAAVSWGSAGAALNRPSTLGQSAGQMVQPKRPAWRSALMVGGVVLLGAGLLGTWQRYVPRDAGVQVGQPVTIQPTADLGGVMPTAAPLSVKAAPKESPTEAPEPPPERKKGVKTARGSSRKSSAEPASVAPAIPDPVALPAKAPVASPPVPTKEVPHGRPQIEE